MDLKNRRALVTGASSGIGAATVHALREAGARVAAAARRTDQLQGDLNLPWTSPTRPRSAPRWPPRPTSSAAST
ncbi:SDR family NAD(P)-dependent oxidoreductase [Actinoplanes bogorensis]|uniref:SDR family NAD(P)-dependent oxidoreductase n=1 Tax=Paractinoplanes bogorensis TaxID=1610840 RepID=A0ABS5YRL7_9ACTN|nr:SDR family NAD(P)-dependent oxidoreductase [Actinoplanes bogorensis]MBU2666085.1 SDR family NAD(P)-dependent oxidoreductase [Actinoplanes bogorensis]